jgi:hypothetical protein
MYLNSGVTYEYEPYRRDFFGHFLCAHKESDRRRAAVSYKESSNEFVHHGALRMKM